VGSDYSIALLPEVLLFVARLLMASYVGSLPLEDVELRSRFPSYFSLGLTSAVVTSLPLPSFPTRPFPLLPPYQSHLSHSGPPRVTGGLP